MFMGFSWDFNGILSINHRDFMGYNIKNGDETGFFMGFTYYLVNHASWSVQFSFIFYPH
jgi:hypothetical protein